MKIHLKGVYPRTLISVWWQKFRVTRGVCIPIQCWFFEDYNSDVQFCEFRQQPVPADGYYVVRCFLPGHKLFEYFYAVHEEMERVNVRHEEIGVRRKTCRPVIWGGDPFESARVLADHLGLNRQMVYGYIASGRKLRKKFVDYQII